MAYHLTAPVAITSSHRLTAVAGLAAALSLGYNLRRPRQSGLLPARFRVETAPGAHTPANSGPPASGAPDWPIQAYSGSKTSDTDSPIPPTLCASAPMPDSPSSNVLPCHPTPTPSRRAGSASLAVVCPRTVATASNTRSGVSAETGPCRERSPFGIKPSVIRPITSSAWGTLAQEAGLGSFVSLDIERR